MFDLENKTISVQIDYALINKKFFVSVCSYTMWVKIVSKRLVIVDYEQSLSFLGPSSKTPETRKCPRASHARALPLLNLKEKRECSQSIVIVNRMAATVYERDDCSHLSSFRTTPHYLSWTPGTEEQATLSPVRVIFLRRNRPTRVKFR